MANKRGIQLSLQTIIYIILALVFLGVGISFIQKISPPEIDIPTTCDIYPPTSESPVCVADELELKRGQTAKLSVAFYNDEDADIDVATLPTITCGTNTDGQELGFSMSTNGVNLPIGESEDYLLIITIPKDAARGMYPCSVSLSSTKESIAIVIV